MISVEEALGRILDSVTPTGTETVNLGAGLGRVLARDVVARRSQPPVAVSAMDGYAVRSQDVATVPAVLRNIGEAPAGGAFEGVLGAGQAVRIFTGGPLPEGADCIVIQENVEAGAGPEIRVLSGAAKGRYVRPAGLDFTAGTVGIEAGRRLAPSDIGLAAAMNVPWLTVRRKPRIALLANGDELVRPGEPLGDNQIISSNSLALAALVEEAGGQPVDLGIAPDRAEALRAMVEGALGMDMLVTMGGASVGDHDLVRSALAPAGLDINFWKIAMRPGKPLIFGKIGATPLLGVPGNPVSALVCGLVYLAPAIEKMLGMTIAATAMLNATLAHDLPENGRRQDYQRAALGTDDAGNLLASPFQLQDSSVLSRLSRADCLVVRPPLAPAARAGEQVPVVPLKRGWWTL